LHPVCGMVVLKATNGEGTGECFTSKINELGMIALPEKLIQKLGWQARSEIAIYHVDEETIILKLA